MCRSSADLPCAIELANWEVFGIEQEIELWPKMDMRRVPGLTSLRGCAMLPASRSWRTGHVDHLAGLPDRVHGLHNDRQRCIGERFAFDTPRGGPLEILRDGDRTDI